MAILSKYPNSELLIISSQKYNVRIKELCRNAAINKIVEFAQYSLTQKLTTTIDKSVLLSNNAARSTFVVQTLRHGALSEEVMKVTGYSNRKAVDKIRNMTDE